MSSYRKDFSRTFVPIANADADDSGPFLKSPKIPTTDLTRNHYGLSYLFVKSSPANTSYTVRATITMDIAFYSYDGNGGVLGPKLLDPMRDMIVQQFAS